jgi:hypothetical protein
MVIQVIYIVNSVLYKKFKKIVDRKKSIVSTDRIG